MNVPLRENAVTLMANCMQAAARLRHIAGTRWGPKMYLNIERLHEEQQEQEMTV